jgi:predicted transcriptional regulator
MITHYRYGHKCSGNKHPNHKVTDAEVQAIRILRLLFRMNLHEIADYFGIKSTYVADISAGRSRQ